MGDGADACAYALTHASTVSRGLPQDDSAAARAQSAARRSPTTPKSGLVGNRSHTGGGDAPVVGMPLRSLMSLDIASMEAEVLDAIELIRPALQSDGG